MSAGAAVLIWILRAVNAWGASPLPPEEVVGAAEVRQRAAESIYQVAYDPAEEPIYRGAHGRARTALWMASTAGEESRFLGRILNGHCRPGECDHGLATGMLQVHLGWHGLRLLGPNAKQCGQRADDCWEKGDLVDDWSMQARAGLHVYRTLGPRAFTSWQRAGIAAAAWYERNPPPADDEQVAGGIMLVDE